MQLIIDPRVDFACKLMLGSPDHPTVTIHFLNSMLSPRLPVVDVEILNPLVGKDRSEEKLVVLDVLARDSSGRQFNIEMQTRLPLAFPNRLLFYNCKNFQRQLREGEGYHELCPAISICLVDRRMIDDPCESRWHHSYRLRCDQDTNLVFTDDFEFHIFELPKFRPSSDNVSALFPQEKWLYLFTHAATTDPDRLSELLGEDVFREAIGVLQMISKSPEDYQYYEDRLKFLRDEQGKLLAAREEGEQLGLAKGLERGKLAGTIQTLQSLVGETISSDAELAGSDPAILEAMIAQLQQRLRARNA